MPNISLNALMTAIKAVQRDIAYHEKLAADTSLSDDDLDYYGQCVLDLTQVFGELGMTYQDAQKEHPEFPTYDELTKEI
ncbi:MAG: hypothetical protein HYZ45_12000 [Burkholderiales bacterium]|nr:hypothetical protein [Burkholderiales bacterium]